jgi:hypothetical protein|tara:strand:- start:426 stop:560 length:135 start_codon:yes stop_codon:yes gene_type:complete
MMQHHKYSLNELDEMLPWEREVYVSMLLDFLKEEADRQKQQSRK